MPEAISVTDDEKDKNNNDNERRLLDGINKNSNPTCRIQQHHCSDGTSQLSRVSPLSSSSSSSSSGRGNVGVDVASKGGTTTDISIPVAIVTLLVLCSLSFIGGEMFRMRMPHHILSRLAASFSNRMENKLEQNGVTVLLSPSSSSSSSFSTGRLISETDGDSAGTTTTTTMKTTMTMVEDGDGATRLDPSQNSATGTMTMTTTTTTTKTTNNNNKKEKTLPRPKLQQGKTMPETRYTAGFHPKGSVEAVRASFDLHIEGGGGKGNVDDDGGDAQFCKDGGGGGGGGKGQFEAEDAPEENGAGGTVAGTLSTNSKVTDDDNDNDDDEKEEEEHLPAGQHLLADIKYVDGTFLDSEERLARAMVELVDESSLTLLSYHCHSLLPTGVSCVGVLLESHISFHTWPEDGVITLDLFTCGPKPLLSAVQAVERLFAIPLPDAGTYQPPPSSPYAGNGTYLPREEDYVPYPQMVWSHVLRGFRFSSSEGGGGGGKAGVKRGSSNILEKDMSRIVLARHEFDYKAEVVSVQTPYQHISVFDVIDPHKSTRLGYDRSILPDPPSSFSPPSSSSSSSSSSDATPTTTTTGTMTYERRHPEFFRPDRMVFLDGVVQSTRNGNEAYHEALVHPGMFAHPSPRTVAILGGGDGATLREVLKHRTVERVKMIEIDEDMVNVSRQYLSDWSDCSDLVLVGGTTNEGRGGGSCFDDDRVELLHDDALAWVIRMYGWRDAECSCEASDEPTDEPTGLKRDACACDEGDSEDGEDEDDHEHDDDEKEERKEIENVGSSGRNMEGENPTDTLEETRFDVIIMDALDPQEDVHHEFYNGVVFMRGLYEALSDVGVLVVHLGMSPGALDPAEELGKNRKRATVMSMIEDVGFKSVHVYDESHSGFQYPWSFLVACKSYNCRLFWYGSEAYVALSIQSRIARTKSGNPALKYFDGATMRSYQVPPKAWENIFCRRDPVPEECLTLRGLDPKVRNFGLENFEVRTSSLGEWAGRGTFTKVDIPKGSLIIQEDAHRSVYFSPLSTYLGYHYFEKLEQAEDLGDVLRYMIGYGFESMLFAEVENYVDSGILTFVNHGCNGTSNIGQIREFLTYGNTPYWNESLIDPNVDPFPKDSSTHIFRPVYERHLFGVATSLEASVRDIRAGEELLSNYVFYISNSFDWVREVKDLQAQCRGEAVGQIKKDESASESQKVAKSNRSETDHTF